MSGIKLVHYKRGNSKGGAFEIRTVPKRRFKNPHLLKGIFGNF